MFISGVPFVVASVIVQGGVMSRAGGLPALSAGRVEARFVHKEAASGIFFYSCWLRVYSVCWSTMRSCFFLVEGPVGSNLGRHI